MKLESKTAIITGGASGLGLAAAQRLANAGVKVGLFDLNEKLGEEKAKELGGIFAKVDVTSCDDVAAGFAKVRGELGQESILINCAGAGNAVKTAGRDKKTGEVKHFPIDEYARIIEINLIGTFRCTAKSAAGMMTVEPVDGERGVIINTASVAAEDGQMGQAAYAASKAGVVGMTLPIARDLAKEKIRINTILPGLFSTPMMHGAPDHVLDALAAQVPNPPRLGDPEEYASLALEMCRNAYFNGEDVRLDGAIRMAPR